MPHDYGARLARASNAAAANDLGALVVAPSADLQYLTGYAPMPLPRFTSLVLRPEADPVLIVPRLERPLAEDAGLARLAEIRVWAETEDPYAIAAAVIGKAGHIGCSERMWAMHLLGLQQAMGRGRFVSAARALTPLRAVKDTSELGLLKRAARYADEAFARLLGTRLETATERTVAGRLAGLLLESGNDDVEFTIVGSGPNGASPHHEPGGREILAGDGVVLDFGGRTGGYCSDISRTVAVGAPSPEFKHVYEIVREAQEEAFRAVAPDVPAQDVDRAAREVIERSGYGDLFVHRTGHGIGLEVHEPPYIVEGNREPLRPGMCFSIEPGIYLPGQFGVRIEDIVAVTEKGARRLNHATRELEVAR
ncbi:MAG: aminopeptidase P family protein [Actinomycetota bacterium]|nr:aminopeptidase P family protein [Actinomycetota bacterium]